MDDTIEHGPALLAALAHADAKLAHDVVRDLCPGPGLHCQRL